MRKRLANKYSRWLAASLAVYFVFIFFMLFASSISARADGSTGSIAKPVYVLDLKGIINPFTAKYILRGIGEAERAGAQLLVIQMDTPGGLDPSMRDIDSAILNADIPVAVYVAPKGARAASAGVFITYSSDIAAMSPGTNIGAAHHVTIGGGGSDQQDDSWIKQVLKLYEDEKKRKEAEKNGESGIPGTQPADPPAQEQPASTQNEDQIMSEKITNDAVAYIVAIADLKGRNAQWAEKAVRESVSIPATEAFNIKVIEYLADSLDSLLTQINGKTIKKNNSEYVLATIDAPKINVPMSAIESLMLMITNPQVAYLLFMIGIYGLIYEITHPGAIFPGVVGATSLVLAIMAFNYLPITSVGVVLIVLGVIFMIAEMKVPGVGILAVGGIICFILGSFLLIDRNYGEMVIQPATYLPTAGLAILLFVILLPKVYKSQHGKIVSGIKGLEGISGKVVKEISPEGKVYIRGEYWDAVSEDGSAIPLNTRIEVVRKLDDEMGLIVKRKPN